MARYDASSAVNSEKKRYIFVHGLSRNKRHRGNRACHSCRKRKVRCDGASPDGTWPCGACVRLKLNCCPPAQDLIYKTEAEDIQVPAVHQGSRTFDHNQRFTHKLRHGLGRQKPKMIPGLFENAAIFQKVRPLLSSTTLIAQSRPSTQEATFTETETRKEDWWSTDPVASLIEMPSLGLVTSDAAEHTHCKPYIVNAIHGCSYPLPGWSDWFNKAACGGERFAHICNTSTVSTEISTAFRSAVASQQPWIQAQ